MKTQFDNPNKLSKVLQTICGIAEKSSNGDYVFRGETMSYEKVMSSLYRRYQSDIETDNLEIEFVQKEILDEARKYIRKTDELEILIELLYHGVTTNLIEFTTDSHIALFFACDGSPTEDGRVILQKRDSIAGYLRQPNQLNKCIIAQKTVFVQPPKGFINPDEVITIPADLKLPILEHLRKSHGISTETIHNDFHSFIRYWNTHEGAYTRFHRGTACQKSAGSVQNWSEKLRWYERAVVHYTEALKMKPDFPEGYNNRGTVYDDAGDFDRAIQDYNKAIDLKPNYADAYYNRGNAYGHKGDFDRAIQDYNKAIDLKPSDASVYYNRGNAYKDNGDFARAIQDYNKAIELKPNYAEAYNNRGVAYSSKGDFARAIRDYDTAIELKPDHVSAYYNRGNAYRQKGEIDPAIQDYSMAIELKPNYAEAYNNRGVAYGDKGNFDRAIQDYSMAIELKPNYAEVYNNRGVDYRNRGDFEKAIQDHNTVIKLRPDYAKAYCIRGKTWLHLKEWKKAKADLTLARDRGIDVGASFHNDYKSVEDFEQKNNVRLPVDIATMLRQAQN